MSRRCPLATLAAAIASWHGSAASADPAPLDDATLAEVTAGTTAAAPAEGERPSAVVADGAQYVLELRRTVEMLDRAQQGARALNAVSGAGSDVANATNVLASGAGTASQSNRVQQLDLQAGALGGASLVSAIVRESREIATSAVSGSSAASASGWRLEARSRTRTVDQFSAFVPAFEPLQNLTLSFGTPKLPSIEVPRFEVDFVEETDVGSYGIRGFVGPFTLGVPQLVLGSVSLDGDDVVLSSGYVDLPSIDLGSAGMQVCFVACTPDVSVDLGGFSGRRIELPGADLRLEGANPFKDVRINAGHGVAAVGQGSISVTPGHLRLGAAIELDLPDLDFSFDFQIPGISFGELGSIGPWNVDGPDIDIEIPAVEFHHDLIDLDVGVAYSATFDGVLCLAFHATECGSGSRHEERMESRIEEEIRAAAASSHASSYGYSSGEIDVLAGATLTGAEAELIVMSRGSAWIGDASDVVLADGAQQGLSAINAVNAVGTIVGNGVNVTSVRPQPAAWSAAPGALSQSNVFVQFRTRYGQ